jgi:hypothetical protein
MNMAGEANQVVTNTSHAFTSTWEALVASFSQAYQQVIDFAPKVVVMLVVLVLGYVISRFLASVAVRLAESLGLQTAAERSGLADSMQHMGIKRNTPSIVGTVVFWLLMLVFVMAAFQALNLPQVSLATAKVVSIIPNLLVATVVIVAGLLIAAFVRGVVATSADRVGLSYAEHLANACYYVLATLTFIGAFNQLDIKFELLNTLIQIAFGALAVAFGLSVGLGGRDVMAGILAGYYVRQRMHAGDHVTIGHLEGTIREVGPVATIVETEEDGLLNRRSIPNTKMLNEAVR